MVARDIAAGAELLVYYSDSYRRGGYSALACLYFSESNFATIILACMRKKKRQAHDAGGYLRFMQNQETMVLVCLL